MKKPKNLECSEPSGKVVDFIKFGVEPFIEYSLYIVGMATIVVGVVTAIWTGLENLRSMDFDERTTEMRIQLSESIALGLTFILGAEVVKSFRIPTLYQLLRVSLLVLLRQLITYFLDEDVKRLRGQFPARKKT